MRLNWVCRVCICPKNRFLFWKGLKIPFIQFCFGLSKPGPGCSKLTTSSVNESLKFRMLISQIRNIFCWKNVRSFCSANASLIFPTKNISVFGYKVVKHLTSWPLNELVKLTMLWTTGLATSRSETYALLFRCLVGVGGENFCRVFAFRSVSWQSAGSWHTASPKFLWKLDFFKHDVNFQIFSSK